MANNKKSPQKKASSKAAPKGGAVKKAQPKKQAAKKPAVKSPTPRKKKVVEETNEEVEAVISALDEIFSKKAEKVASAVAPIVEEVTLTINENVTHVQSQVKKISKWRKFFKFGKK